jgi:CRP-like cAMP-binding protein
VIVREGSSAHGFHLIVDGEVSVDVDGEVQTVLGPGSFFGEMALIDRGPRSATLTAATSVSALVLDAVDFRRLLLSDARIGYQLLVHVSRRLREAQGSPLD